MNFEQNGLKAVPSRKILDEDLEKGLYKEVSFCVLMGSQEDKIGHFYFSPMPGCCGVVVSHTTYLYQQYRGSGISSRFRALKDHVAKALGYSCVVMTCDMSNIPGVKNMFNRGFKVATTFTNKRTTNLIALGVKNV